MKGLKERGASEVKEEKREKERKEEKERVGEVKVKKKEKGIVAKVFGGG